MKTVRLPRFRRVAAPPPMVLTARDREILRQVYVYRLLTREQIERLLFPPKPGQDHPTRTSKARQRLQLLYQHGYVERIPTPVREGAWAWRPVYRLGRQGAACVAAELSTTVGQLAYWGHSDDRTHRTTQVSRLFLEHTLEVNDVRIAVALAASARGYMIEKWLDDTELKRQEMKEYVAIYMRGQSQQVAVIPDAYFKLRVGERKAHFFLELDRGTMSGRRWEAKVLAYLMYLQTGKYEARYQTKSVRVLTVTTSWARVEGLRRTTARVERAWQQVAQVTGASRFWFTALPEVSADRVLSAPIWLLASDEHASARKTLVE